jgi:hypothetical protein
MDNVTFGGSKSRAAKKTRFEPPKTAEIAFSMAGAAREAIAPKGGV